MYGLEGRKAIVTGGAAGIGRAISKRLAEEGCAIGILDIDGTQAECTAGEIRAAGGEAFVATGNTAVKDDVYPALDTLMGKLGPVDILVNNAGILRLGRLLEMDEADWVDTFRVNVDGLFWVTRKVLPGMVERGSGCVVNMASWMGKAGVANYGAYCASKFAIVGLTQSLALEVASSGVRVNAVCPGIIVDTAMREASDAKSRSLGLPVAADRIGTVPLGRLGLPVDVARLVAFLASDEADYLTGQAVNTTGGLWNH